MKNQVSIPKESSIEDYEVLFEWGQEKAKSDSLKKEIEHVKMEMKAWEQIPDLNLPPDEFCNALDSAFGVQDSLIRPSHMVLPYSLIKDKEVDTYIPENFKHTSVLSSLLKDNAIRSLEIVQEYTSENTQRAFNGDIVYWQAWLSAIGCDFKTPPITLEVVKLFIIQHVEEMDVGVDRKLFERGYKARLGTHSIETVKRRLASLSRCLDLTKLHNPCRDKEIKILLGQLAKKYGKTKRKKVITKDILDDMILTCKSSLIDIRDKALLFFAWSSGGRRRAEVVDAHVSNLIDTPDGDFLYNLTESKTNQTGEDDYKPIKGRAAKALRDWIDASGVKEGHIFRSIGKKGDVRGALSGNDVRRIVKKRANLAGYDENLFSAHSLRRGFVTESGRQGKPIGDVMKLTSHKSISTAMKYYEAGNVTNNSCAELAG